MLGQFNQNLRLLLYGDDLGYVYMIRLDFDIR